MVKSRKQLNRESQIRLKERVFSEYAYATNGKIRCSRCGFEDIRALHLHHIFHNGTEHRKYLQVSGGRNFYFALEKLGYPKNPEYPLIILCSNCNLIVEDIHNQEISEAIQDYEE